MPFEHLKIPPGKKKCYSCILLVDIPHLVGKLAPSRSYRGDFMERKRRAAFAEMQNRFDVVQNLREILSFVKFYPDSLGF